MLPSFKKPAKGLVILSIATTVGNVVLNHLVAPPDGADRSTSGPRAPFDPTATDVIDYEHLNFLEDGEQMELTMGLSYILQQSAPRWIQALTQRFSPITITVSNTTKSVTTSIYDARKTKDSINFEDSGFTLIDISEDRATIDNVTDWRAQGSENPWQSADPRMESFQATLETRLLKLLPNATRIKFTSNVIRGGNKFGDQPAAIDGPHLDYTQNDTAREEFHKEYPVNENVKEQLALLGEWDTEEEEVVALLGLWKPVLMNNPVCDHPLAVMDARTFLAEDSSPYPIHINFLVFILHNLNGAIHHRPEQKWYYYPFQTENEVLVFHQYSKGTHFANPHTSFVNPNCPEEYETRISIEMRAAVFEKKRKD